MVRVRNAPQDVGLAPPMGGNDHFDWAQCKAPPSGRDGLRGVLRRTFAHPRLRWAALTNAAQGFVQGSAVLWVPTYLVEALNMDIGGAATSAVVLPLCGLAGVLVGGWASDRFFRSRVAPMTAVMMAGLAASVLATSFLAPQGGLAPAVALLGLIGAITHGVGSILVTVLPLSLGHEGGVSSAAGFLDFAGYVGAGVGGLLAGAIVDGWGWDAVFVCWAVVALLGLATTVPLRRSER
jgi:OPA family glycerol-3-phosphate transporter-like MFS transporter